MSLTHLGPLRVRRGASVAEGDVVAEPGPTGEAEHAVPYVHLGVRVGAARRYVDPLSLLPPRGAPTLHLHPRRRPPLRRSPRRRHLRPRLPRGEPSEPQLRRRSPSPPTPGRSARRGEDAPIAAPDGSEATGDRGSPLEIGRSATAPAEASRRVGRCGEWRECRCVQAFTWIADRIAAAALASDFRPRRARRPRRAPPIRLEWSSSHRDDRSRAHLAREPRPPTRHPSRAGRSLCGRAPRRPSHPRQRGGLVPRWHSWQRSRRPSQPSCAAGRTRTAPYHWRP